MRAVSKRAVFRQMAFGRFLVGLWGMLLAAVMMPVAAGAHPMPDSEIIVARGPTRVDFTIRVPMDDLLLAMKDDPAAAGLPRDADALLAQEQAGGGKDGQGVLKAYLAGHMALEVDGKHSPLTIDAVRRVSDSDADVGHYSELEVAAHGDVAGNIAAQLAYDLVLGRIANHRALVSEPGGTAIGVIRYSLADKKAEALSLPVAKAPLASAPRDRPLLKSATSVDKMVMRLEWLLGLAVVALGGIGLWLWRRGRR